MRRRAMLQLALSSASLSLVGCERALPLQPNGLGAAADKSAAQTGVGPGSGDGHGGAEPAHGYKALLGSIRKLIPLHRKLSRPKRGEWLAEHDEPGQSFDQYRVSEPVLPELDKAKGRRTLYIQPLGPLDDTQQRLVQLTASYVRDYFGLPVQVRAGLPLSLLPPDARRVHPQWGDAQLLTSYILDRVLAPRLPADAAAYISFTASDLWPGAGYNFVFGQASLRDRVGVWSIYRNGDPEESTAAFQLALLRTLKIAVHELGHMFSLEHCIAYACVMGGANNRDESDRAPLWACPQCMAKICWLSRTGPRARYLRLQQRLTELGLLQEAQFMARSAAALVA